MVRNLHLITPHVKIRPPLIYEADHYTEEELREIFEKIVSNSGLPFEYDDGTYNQQRVYKLLRENWDRYWLEVEEGPVYHKHGNSFKKADSGKTWLVDLMYSLYGLPFEDLPLYVNQIGSISDVVAKRLKFCK